MTTEDLIRKGMFSFIIGFIVTMILGVILAFIFSNESYQGYWLSGGFPLPWLNIIFGQVTYDVVGLILDLLFWTFIIFLVITRNKEKSNKSDLFKFFKLDYENKKINTIIINSILLSFGLFLIVLLFGLIQVFTTTSNQIFRFSIGFPFTWFQIFRISQNANVVYEITSVPNIFINFIIYFIIFFVAYYVWVAYNKKD